MSWQNEENIKNNYKIGFNIYFFQEGSARKLDLGHFECEIYLFQSTLVIELLDSLKARNNKLN